eukprot:10562160-Alexandrium_andersonii.AAC.1
MFISTMPNSSCARAPPLHQRLPRPGRDRSVGLQASQHLRSPRPLRSRVDAPIRPMIRGQMN